MAKLQMNFTNLDFKETAELAELQAKMDNLNAETVNLITYEGNLIFCMPEMGCFLFQTFVFWNYISQCSVAVKM